HLTPVGGMPALCRRGARNVGAGRARARRDCVPVIIRPGPKRRQLLYGLHGSMARAVPPRVRPTGPVALAWARSERYWHPFGRAEATVVPFFTLLVLSMLAYAFFGLAQLREEREEPFGLEPNDLPLDAMVRTIESDVLDALGDRQLPEPLQLQGYQ